jgi:hypothetical protein
MYESVTVSDLARMFPRASRASLRTVLALCQSPAGDRELRELLSACDCVAGAIYCRCGAGSDTASALLDRLAAVYEAGRGESP